jgi:outer membrane lipoprotein-sorting protein
MRLCRRSLSFLLATLLLRRHAKAEAAIDELMQALARIPESHAAFTEDKTLAVLTRPLHATGRLYYRRPAHLEKITLEPQTERLVVDGNRLTLVEPDAAPRMIDLDAEPAIRALVDAIRGTLSGDLPALRRSYAVIMQGSLASWRLTLTPTDPRVARLIVRTTIEGAGTALQLVQTTQANGDEIRMTIRPNS